MLPAGGMEPGMGAGREVLGVRGVNKEQEGERDVTHCDDQRIGSMSKSSLKFSR